MDKEPTKQSFPVRVRSGSSPSELYNLDPAQCRCTCPDWQKRRGEFPNGDPRRMCKHLVMHWCEHPEMYPERLGWYREEFLFRKQAGKGFSLSAQRDQRILPSGKYIDMYAEPGSPWLSIFDGSGRYGFNVQEIRWARGAVPRDGREIVRVLMDVGPDLPKGCIRTRSRGPLGELEPESVRGVVQVEADVKGIRFIAFINPNGPMQTVDIDGPSFDVDIEGDGSDIPVQYMRFDQALLHWLRKEHSLAKGHHF